MHQLLRPSQIKEKYNISITSLYNWEKAGLINPVQTPGGHRRYSEADIQKILKIKPKAKKRKGAK